MNGKLKIEVPLAVVSCDFRVAPTMFREKLVSTPERRRELFRAIHRIDPAAGYLALETCNRTEWLVSTENPAWLAELLKAHMLQLWQETLPGLASYPSPAVYLGAEAVRHVYRVVMGLESLATGEAQIAGQFQNAMVLAREEETLSPLLNRLGSGAGRLAKAGSRLGFRSNHRRGIHGLVCRSLQHEFREAGSPRSVAVVGMGGIGRKTAQLLEDTGGFRVLRVNRTIRPEHQGSWRHLDELPSLCGQIDALVVATGGLNPILTPQRLDLTGRNEVLPIVDIGIPRQVEASVQVDPKVRYRNIDHLLDLPRDEVDAGTLQRVEAELDKEMERFLRFCMERDLVLLLDRIHQGRHEFAISRIPAHVAATCGDLDDRTRQQVEAAMKKVVADYAGEIHQALQQALEEYWSRQ